MPVIETARRVPVFAKHNTSDNRLANLLWFAFLVKTPWRDFPANFDFGFYLLPSTFCL